MDAKLPLPPELESKIIDELFEFIGGHVGLTGDHLLKLFDDGDWTLVVKCCALAEAAISGGLIRTVAPPSVAEWIARQSLDRKTQLAEDCQLISRSNRRSVMALARVRNSCVHDVSAFTFSLAEYFGDEARLREFSREAFSFGGLQTMAGEDLEDKVEFVRKNPRFALWSIAIGVVNVLAVGHSKTIGGAT